MSEGRATGASPCVVTTDRHVVLTLDAADRIRRAAAEAPELRRQVAAWQTADRARAQESTELRAEVVELKNAAQSNATRAEAADKRAVSEGDRADRAERAGSVKFWLGVVLGAAAGGGIIYGVSKL